jgi:phytoene dehydrogenase-like protein
MAERIAVVGGGLAGLAAAAYLAPAGRHVTVYEKARIVGGRAVTTVLGGYRFNLGPHALYVAGEGRAVLKELDVPVRGARPPASGAFAIRGGRLDTLPAGPMSLLATGLLSLGAKIEVARILAVLPKMDPASLRGQTVAGWLLRISSREEVRDLLAALVRVATYANDPARQGADSAVAQLQRALRSSVLYLDGGWQSIVDALRERAEEAGVRIETDAPVRRVVADGSVRAVLLADGRERDADAVVATGSPAQVAALVPEAGSLCRAAARAMPVRAACLDVALDRVPRPQSRFALGIDTPLYVSLHSAVARLAPEGGGIIHAAKYLTPEATHEADHRPDEVRRELEQALELLQPGWQSSVVHQRFLPDMVVSNALTTTSPRPQPAVPEVPGLFVAGDWVGSEGLLADASLASARSAARAVLSAVRAPLPEPVAVAE